MNIQDRLAVAHIGLVDYQDRELLSSIELMSKNRDMITGRYSSVPCTQPLFFDFFNRPIVFLYNYNWPDLYQVIETHLFPQSSIILVNFGLDVAESKYSKKTWGVDRLRMLVKTAEKSRKPTIYALNDDFNKSNINKIRHDLSIPDTGVIIKYSYYQPNTLKQVIRELVRISG